MVVFVGLRERREGPSVPPLASSFLWVGETPGPRGRPSPRDHPPLPKLTPPDCCMDAPTVLATCGTHSAGHMWLVWDIYLTKTFPKKSP